MGRLLGFFYSVCEGEECDFIPFAFDFDWGFVRVLSLDFLFRVRRNSFFICN